LVTDLPADFETFGQAVDTSLAELKGGTSGQVLSKASNTDMDFTWVTSDDANAIQNTIVDAKGDLIAASASDVPARLAVGANGEILVADSSTATGLKWSTVTAASTLVNPVINGGMDIWQRGTSFTIGAGAFTADRWKCSTGGPTLTVSRQTTSDTTNLPNIQYSTRVQRNSGQTSTAAFNFANSFESVNSTPFVGKTVTFSFYARAGANYSATSNALSANLYSGTGTDQNWIDVAYTGQATVAGGTATLTTTWQRFAFTGTIGATATELAIVLQAAGTGTAGANDWYEVTGVQIDLGTYTNSTAPTFRRSGGEFQGELANCQRYYWRTTDDSNADSMGVFGLSTNTTSMLASITFPVNMRVQPSTIDFANLRIYDGNNVYAVTALALSSPSPQIGQVIATVASGLTSSRAYFIIGASGNGYIGWNAEL
jgi:hypothetical protein